MSLWSFTTITYRISVPPLAKWVTKSLKLPLTAPALLRIFKLMGASPPSGVSMRISAISPSLVGTWRESPPNNEAKKGSHRNPATDALNSLSIHTNWLMNIKYESVSGMVAFFKFCSGCSKKSVIAANLAATALSSLPPPRPIFPIHNSN